MMKVNVNVSSSSFESLRIKLGEPEGLELSGSWIANGQQAALAQAGRYSMRTDLNVFYRRIVAQRP